MNAPTTVIKGFRPRPSQLEVLQHPARFKILNCGRRWGKTLLASNWLTEGAINRGGENWWISPTYAQSKTVFRDKLSAAKKGGAAVAMKDVSRSELRIEYHTGGVEFFKSADNPDNLRGEGLQRVVLDEAARQAKETWEEVVRAAVTDTGGKVMFTSTPKGKNWFFKLWGAGQDPLQPTFKSWTFPTSDNPINPPEDIEQARRSLPADVFAQEYEAAFLENSAGVFRNVAACAQAQRQEPAPGRTYYAGLDLARLSDFTVLSIIDDEGVMVYQDRYNLLDWTVQKQRVLHDLKRYNDASCLQDSTGVGDPIFDDLRRAGANIDGYKFTNESKAQLVEFLQLAFDQQRIKILNEPVLRNELESYEYTINRSGSVSYNAPAGQHDDTVVALALAWWHRGHRAEPRIRRL
jgi:phage FluMu gp28-like protein